MAPTGVPDDDALPLVVVYADESCLGNGRAGANPGGAAGLIEYRAPGSAALVRRDYWISEPATTNNRMALRSAIEAFRALGAKGRRLRVLFRSDSRYIVSGMSEWVHGWMARGWRRKGGAIENLDLWREAAEVVRPHLTQWLWVPGHAGHPQNEYVNWLAVRAAGEQTASGGLLPSEFDRWLAGERARGKITAAPDPFPESGAFRPGRALPPSPAARLP